MRLGIIILAAGEGKRMRSQLPKVMHPLAGRPLLAHVLQTARALEPQSIAVVYGHLGEQIKAYFADQNDLLWVEQSQRLGTGHAVKQALPLLRNMDRLLILYGDVPLLSTASLEPLCHSQAPLHLLTVHLEDAEGYGRIVRNAEGDLIKIVEHRDANAEELKIKEVNTGIMAGDYEVFQSSLEQIKADNAQGEYYLTDIVQYIACQNRCIETSQPQDPMEAQGVNNRRQLAELERYYQQQQAHLLMGQGVSLADPERLDIRGSIEVGQDIYIDCNVILEGQIKLGHRVRIGAGCVLRDVVIADEVNILPYSVIEGAKIGAGASIGPFARIRPQTELAEQVKVGNFVEIKNAQIGQASKINHLSYIGDTQMGAEVNIGAGTITCNYDGAHKHRTWIGDQAFIGSNSALVAPVSIGKGATIGAGSVITKDAPAQQLSLSRAKQITIKNWIRPRKD